MKYRKLAVLFSFILFFCGCAATRAQTTRPHRRPVGFWENKEAVVQVMHFFSQVTPDNKGQLVLDDKGKLTTSIEISLGMGAVVDTNGLVLTNNHIVNEQCPIVVAPDKLTAPLPEDCPLKVSVTPDQLAAPLPPEEYLVCNVVNGRHYCHPAELVVADPKHDLVLLRTNQRFPRAVKFVDDGELVPGDEVYFWGNVSLFLPPSPFFGRYTGRIGPPYYTGSNFETQLPLLMLDLNFNRGSSGSPMFNEEGKCIGVGKGFTNASMLGGRALGITVPSSTVIKFIKANPWPRPKK